VGYTALNANNYGSSGTAVGDGALSANTTGINNTALGAGALNANTGGYYNTAIGSNSATSTTTGTNNSFLGYGAVAATATTNNSITLGNSSITTLRCQVTSITALSDARDKTNIQDIPAGLDFVQQLRPVSFDWNTRDGAKIGIPEFGFIAQELQKAQENAGVKVPNLVLEENPEKLEAAMGTLIPILVKAIQELNQKIERLEANA